MCLTWVFKNRFKNTLTEWRSHLAEGSPLDDPVVIKIRSKEQIKKLLDEVGFEIVVYKKKGFVQGYIPFVGKFLSPNGYVLNFFASFLGWYHCFTCRVKS